MNTPPEGVTLPIFFAELDFNLNQEIFQAVNLQSAPFLFLVPPSFSTNSPKIGTLYNKLRSKYNFGAVQPNVRVSEITDFIARRTGVSIEAQRTVGVSDLGHLVFLLGTGLFAFYCYAVRFRTIPLIYFLTALVFYLFCSSGGMYNILRGMPFSQVGQRGEVQYISYGHGGQYGAESMIVGSLVFGCALLLILLNSLSFKTWQGSSFSGVMSWLSSPFFTSALLLFLWKEYLGVYTMKNPSYRFGFVWDRRSFDELF